MAAKPAAAARLPEAGREPAWGRILLKLSGEVFAHPSGHGIDAGRLNPLVRDIRAVYRRGVQLCIVVGAGNIFRGNASTLEWLDRPTADEMGMLGTLINGLALHAALRAHGVRARMMSALEVSRVCEPFARWRAHAFLDESHVLVFAGGTGNPLFTTDTAAALRASELRCDAILKGTQVDGVYDSDPRRNPDARRLDRVSYRRALSDNLGVMDSAAVSIARDADIPIVVFSLGEKDAIQKVVAGEGRFTVISGEGD